VSMEIASNSYSVSNKCATVSRMWSK